MIPVFHLNAATRLSAFLLLQFLCATLALAMSDTNAPVDFSLNSEEIKGQIESLEAGGDTALDPDKQLTLDNFKAALARIDSAKASQKKAVEYANALKTAPALVADLAEELGSPVEDITNPNPAELSPAQAQLRMATLQIKAVSLRTEGRRIEESVRVMDNRQIGAREELTGLREKLDRKPEAVPTQASPMLLESFRVKSNAIGQDLSARIANVEQEILSLPTREAIANAKHNLVERELRQVERDISDLGRRMDAQEQEDTTAKVEAADNAVLLLANGPAAFRSLAVETATLRKEMSVISSNLRKLWSVKDRIHSQLQNISVSRKNADQILAIGRIGDEHGRLLREVAKKLPVRATLLHKIDERQSAIVDARVEQFQTEQQLGKAAVGPAGVDRFLESSHVDPTDLNRSQAHDLLIAYRSALSDLFDIEGRQVEALAEVNALQVELLQRSSQLRSVLDQRLLWLPSTSPIGTSWGGTLIAGVGSLLTAENLGKLEPSASVWWKSFPLGTILLLGMACILLFLRKRLSRQLDKFAKPIGTRSDRFMLTINALMVTVVMTLPVPIVFGCIGSIFAEPYNPTSFPNVLARGLYSAAIVLLILGFFRNMCRHNGLFVAHFRWDAVAMRRLGQGLWMVTLAIAPAAFVTALALNGDDATLVDGLGRLSMLVGSLALAVFNYRTFKPVGGALAESLTRTGLFWRTRGIWYPTLVAAPLVLAMLAIAGYYVSAAELQARLVTSGWIILSVIIIYQVAMRGVLVAGRQAAYKQAEVRLAKQVDDALASRQSGGDVGEGAPIQQQDPEIDVVTVSKQTRGVLSAVAVIVLGVFLWEVWSGLLPALAIFNDFVLWSDVVTTSTGKVVTEVTLGHIMFSGLLLALTVLAVRNLPGFLEMVVLHRFDLDSGTRYAYVTILRYTILAIGLIVSFSHIGVDWSKLQWIVAALGVGLGFGLQEIVANFVSGIIILFERPVRVGDLISIDNTVGTVTKIKIRAITITDPDNFEVLVPNKAFITGTVKNWSLTTSITRLVVKVGIAYGSDVGHAQRVLLGIAKAEENVLDSPAPIVLFLAFGDSSLDLELRVFVGSIEHRLSTLNNLYTAVHNAFEKAGIEIPFPQRDLHIRRPEGGGLLEVEKPDGNSGGEVPASK